MQALYQQYLLSYAEPEIRALVVPAGQPYRHYCVIPVFDEPAAALQQFLDYPAPADTAFILVFNAPKTATVDAIRRTREAMRSVTQSLAENGPLRELASYLWQGSAADGEASRRDVYVFDFCSAERLLNEKQGVGRARKLGLDWASRLHYEVDESAVNLAAWFHCCDADLDLPPGYFSILPPRPDEVAAIYPFQHLAQAGYELEMALYEFSLRYFVDRLQWAGSPYAFFTIGSTIAVTPAAYLQVRGMPKRAGGEDFYFLNKLAKLGDIRSLEKPCLQISGRPSQRVPFGTGPALNKLATMQDAIGSYVYYHPTIFVLLKQLLLAVESIARGECRQMDKQVFFAALNRQFDRSDTEKIEFCLESLGIGKILGHLSKAPSAARFMRDFHTWFDAFQTLRFVHLMRDQFYPGVALKELAKMLPEQSPELAKRAQQIVQTFSSGEYSV